MNYLLSAPIRAKHLLVTVRADRSSAAGNIRTDSASHFDECGEKFERVSELLSVDRRRYCATELGCDPAQLVGIAETPENLSESP